MTFHYLMNYDTLVLLVLTINSFISVKTEKDLVTSFEECNKNNNTTIKKVIVCLKLICSKSVDGKWATVSEIYAGLFYFIHKLILKEHKEELIEFINQFSEFQFEREKKNEISGLDFMNSQENMKKAYEVINKVVTIDIDDMIDCRFTEFEYEKDKVDKVLKLTFKKE